MAEFIESRSPSDPADTLGRFRVAEASEVDAAVERAARKVKILCNN